MPSSLRNKIPGALIVWVVSYVFFLLTLVNNFSAAHDSINYLYHISTGQHLFHQHHLLYHFFANKWLHLFEGWFRCTPGISNAVVSGLVYCREHYLIESFTALWGSSSLTLVYLIFRNRFTLRRAACLCGTAAVAFSYGAWFYSTNIEVYMPPIFFILACLYIVTGKSFERRDVWKLAVLHSLAILFHQINILFAVVIVYALVRHKFYSSLFLYAAIGLLLTGSAYFVTGWFFEGHNTWAEWTRWVEGYAVGHDYWQPLSLKTPLHVAAGFARAFVGGHFLFRLPFIESRLQGYFQGHGLHDELFLVSGMSPAMATLLLVLALLIAIVFLLLLFRFLRRLRGMKAAYPVIIPIALCIVTYSVFFCFWMPEILEFWILQMILVWMLLIGTARKPQLTYLLPVLLLFVNYFGSMRWLQQVEHDWYYQQAMQQLREGQGDAPEESEDWIMKDYLRYFNREAQGE